jgi:hypothetical protein
VAPAETKSSATIPGYKYKIPQQIMTPDMLETRISTRRFFDGLPIKERMLK